MWLVAIGHFLSLAADFLDSVGMMNKHSRILPNHLVDTLQSSNFIYYGSQFDLLSSEAELMCWMVFLISMIFFFLVRDFSEPSLIKLMFYKFFIVEILWCLLHKD